MFDEEDAHGDQGQHEQLRRRPRRPRAGPEQHDRTNCARSSRNAIPVLHNLALPQTGLRELFMALDRAASQAAPVAETPGRACGPTQDTFFTALASVTPSLEEATVGGPRVARAGDLLAAPTRRRSSKTPPSSCACCARARASLRTVAPQLGHAFAVGAVNLRGRDRAEHAAGRILGRRSPTFASNPLVDARPRRLHADAPDWPTRCSPASRPHRPSATT